MIKKSPYTIVYVFIFIGLIITGCTERDLKIRPAEAEVAIHLDWGKNTPSENTRYIFYEKKGDILYRDGNSDGFRGLLPSGNYNVVIYNTDMSGTALEVGHGFESDYVSALPQSKDMVVPPYIGNVWNVYGCGIPELIVPALPDPVDAFATPKNMVYTIRFLIDAHNIINISSMSVSFSGIVYSVILTSGEAAVQDYTSIREEAVYNPKDSLYHSTAYVFGYIGKQEVVVTVEYADGTIETTIPEDVTEQIKDRDDQEVTIELDLIFPDGDKIHATVIVEGWDNSGTGGGTIIE